MIKFNNLSQDTPYQILKEKYDDAEKAGQKIIEALSVSSYSKELIENLFSLVTIILQSQKNF